MFIDTILAITQAASHEIVLMAVNSLSVNKRYVMFTEGKHYIIVYYCHILVLPPRLVLRIIV